MHNTSNSNNNTLKETYEVPTIEMMTFNSNDLVTTSVNVSTDSDGSGFGPIIRL